MPNDEKQILQNAQLLNQQMQVFDKMADGGRRFGADMAGNKDFAEIRSLAGYAAFKENISKIAEKSSVFFRVLPDGSHKKAQAADIAELIGLYSNMFSGINTFLKQLDDRKEELQNVPAFSAFKSLAEGAKELTALDLHALTAMNPSKPQDLPKKIAESHASKVVLKNNWEKLNSVGANLSKRYPITYKDDKGVEHKGFFTEDKKTDYRDKLRSEISKNLDAAKRDPIVKDNPELHKVMSGFFDNVFKVPELVNNPEALYNEVFKEGALQKHLKDNFAYFEKKYKLPEGHWGWMNKSEDAEVQSRIQKFVNPKEENEKENLEKFCAKYTAPLLNKQTVLRCVVFNQFFPEDMKNPFDKKWNMQINRINGTSIAQRNSAMSAVANLLGAGSVIAFSENVEIESGNEKKSGVFMENAVGEDLGKAVDPECKLGKCLIKYQNNQDQIFSGSAKKDIYALQMLDYICNNVDRHQNNMLYRVDKNAQIVGVQGIDNDLSFGTEVPDPDKEFVIGNGIALNHLLFVPKEMADKINALEPEVLEMALKGFDLDEAERKAAGERLVQVKEALKKGTVKALDDEGFNKLSLAKERQNEEKKAKGGKAPFSQTTHLAGMWGHIQHAFVKNMNTLTGNGNATQKEIANVNPVVYNEAEYKAAAVEIHKIEKDSCSFEADRINAEITGFKEILTKMQETDRNVKLAHAQFGELEKALEKTIHILSVRN